MEFLSHSIAANHPVVTNAAGVLAAYSAFTVARAVYRLYFHPLKDFPGPKDACMSETWLYHLTKAGHPDQEFEKLHKELNTQALRVGPNELHISDVSLYKVIYSQSAPFPKCNDFYAAFNIPHTLLTEIDPKAHKERRKMLSSLLSRMGVLKLERIIEDKLELLTEKISRLPSGQPIDMYNGIRLLTTEVILQFAFARSCNLLEEDPKGFNSWFLDAFDLGSQSIFDMQYRPWLRILAGQVPTSLIRLLSPEVGTLLDMQAFSAESLRLFKSMTDLPSHPVLFDSLRNLPDKLSIDEAQDILVAGADTTAFTLTTGLMHILRNPKIHRKLVEVVDEAMANAGGAPSLMNLEKNDYLTAIVKESLRVATAVPGRLPRRVPENLTQPFVVDGKVIPAGTIVSMSAYTMHTSTDIWGPDALEFNPERWLVPDAKARDQYLCAFSKGARMCIGQNLATAELTMAIPYLFSKFEFSLPADFQPPPKVDRFTNAYLAPGVRIVATPRK